MWNRKSMTLVMVMLGLPCCGAQVYAGTCGHAQTSSQLLQEQAAAYAAGNAYVADAVPAMTRRDEADFGEESAQQTAQREADHVGLRRAQAEAYARGDTLDARRLATMPQSEARPEGGGRREAAVADVSE